MPKEACNVSRDGNTHRGVEMMENAVLISTAEREKKKKKKQGEASSLSVRTRPCTCRIVTNTAYS
jgi:hypothetical protein